MDASYVQRIVHALDDLFPNLRVFNATKGELLEFTETLWHKCENKTILRFDAYVIAIWNGTQIGLNLCNFGKKKYSLHQVSLFVRENLSNKMQSKTTCTIGWTQRPLMFLCGSLYVGLKWMQWIGLPSSTIGETCKTEGYLCSIVFFNYKSRFYFYYSKYQCFYNIV